MQGSARSAVIAFAFVAGVYLLGRALDFGWFMSLVSLGLAGAAATIFTSRNVTRPPVERRSLGPDMRMIAKFSEHIHTAYCLIDQQGLIVYVTPTMTRIFPHIRRGEHYSIIARAQSFLEPIQNAIRFSVVVPSFEFETHRGGTRYFEGRLSILDDDLRDRTRASLMVEIYDQTELHQNDRIRRDFIANASHELRTPLAAIIGGIETLEDNSPDKGVQKPVLKIMKKQAKRMSRLIKGLTSLSKIEDHQHIAPTERVEVLGLLQDAIEATHEGVVTAQQTITLDASKPVYVYGDGDQLQQVFLNILENAVHYGPADQAITIFVVDEGAPRPDLVGIAIRDQGYGIEPLQIHRVTERFYRVPGSGGANKNGTGLGLAIVKHILRRHHGELRIVSEPGAGSTFTIWLPLAKQA